MDQPTQTDRRNWEKKHWVALIQNIQFEIEPFIRLGLMSGHWCDDFIKGAAKMPRPTSVFFQNRIVWAAKRTLSSHILLTRSDREYELIFSFWAHALSLHDIVNSLAKHGTFGATFGK